MQTHPCKLGLDTEEMKHSVQAVGPAEDSPLEVPATTNSIRHAQHARQAARYPAQIRIRIGILASCSVCEANVHRWTYPRSNTWGKHSSVGRIPSQKHEACIRPRTNTLSKTWGEYSSTDEYPLKSMGSIRPLTNTPSKSWASIRTRTNTFSKT